MTVPVHYVAPARTGAAPQADAALAGPANGRIIGDGGVHDHTAACQPDECLVLAIDDDPNTIELLRENLADIGYQVIGATSGADGLAQARARRPHAIMLDIIMPDMDGWQVLHQLKADPATCAIPVVVISVVDQARLGYRLGAAGYLVKPFERDQLAATLGHAAPRWHRLLVVDDDPGIVDQVRQLLEGDDYAIEAVADGRAALRVLAERPPDAILLDLKMPEMNGFDAVRKLQEDADRRGVPVVVLTARLLSRVEEKHLKEHVSGILDKTTLDQNVLVEKLKQILPRGARNERQTSATA